MPQTSGFRSAKQILVVSFATQARAFILSDRNIFYTPGGGGRTRAGSNAPGAFLVFFFLVVTCPRPPVFARPNKYVLQSFGQQKYYLQSVSVDSPKSS